MKKYFTYNMTVDGQCRQQRVKQRSVLLCDKSDLNTEGVASTATPGELITVAGAVKRIVVMERVHSRGWHCVSC